MNKWSTLALTMNLFTPGYELFRELVNSAFLEAAIPYELSDATDQVSRLALGEEIPPDFYERRYAIRNGNRRVALVDAAWHETKGLVSFSFALVPRELFKRRAAKKVFYSHVKPYVEERAGWDLWGEIGPGNHVLIDNNASLAVEAKFYPGKPFMFGLGVMDCEHAGIKKQWLRSVIEGATP